MVVAIRYMAALLALSVSAAVFAQEAFVRAYVDSVEIEVDREFKIHVEARGESVRRPEVPRADGLLIDSRPNTSSKTHMTPGHVSTSVTLSYRAVALHAGTITIPAIGIRVNGRMMYTAPIELHAASKATPSPQEPAKARAWIESDPVVVGVPFWLRIEATGGHVLLPEGIKVDGLHIDNVNIQRQKKRNTPRGSLKVTLSNSYHCTALRRGTLTVPAFTVEVDGRAIETEPFAVAVLKKAPSKPVEGSAPEGGETLTMEDLVFINMETDKTEVYQGEPLLLTKQLWRILDRRIQSGPQRGSLIVAPSTEGFYATYLDPVSYVGTHKGVRYEVNEERKVLYPTAIGDLRIGQWHWEGIALGNRRNITTRFRQHYTLNAGPIRIKVKSLPPRPKGFSGAVGQFKLEGRMHGHMLEQGVPARLVLTVIGVGNPDAIGDPVIAELEWAQISEPHRTTDVSVDAERPYPVVTKEYRYELVPLRSGIVTIPAIEFIYFDPSEDRYVSEAVGPFSSVVQAMDAVPRHVIMAAEEQEAIGSVEILDEDLRPIVRETRRLRAHRPIPYLPGAVAGAPVLAYAMAAVLAGRRRRFATDSRYARAYHARRNAMAGLGEVRAAQSPAESLNQVMVRYIADVFGLLAFGMTSADVREVLEQHGVEPSLIGQAERIMRACERASYAAADLSDDEWKALMNGAHEFVEGLQARSAQ